MNKFSRIMNKLKNLKEYGIDRSKLSKEERAYILLTTNITMFQGVVNEYGNESEFARAYGISNLIYSINNDLVRIYIPKESLSADIRQLMKDLDATVVEYYGIVQFDGTEPEARGEYIFDPVIQMSDKVINNFKGDSSDNSKENNDYSNKDELEDEKEEKPKRKLYRLIKKSDKDLEDEEQDNEEEESNDELEDDSENQEEGELEDNEEDSGENNNNEEDNSDELDDEEPSENDSEEQEDNLELDDESDEDNSEEGDTSDKNSRAYFMRNVKDPNEEDSEGVSDEDNSEDEEDPDSVDQFFDDEEVETNLDKKSDEIEKDLSRELDKRIEDEKNKKGETKNKSKRFKKLKKKEKSKKESIEVSSIPSSRLANLDLMKSLATEPIEYSNFGFSDFDKIEKIIKKSMMNKDNYKKRKLKGKICL